MYIHVQLVLTGNTSYILLLTEPLIIIWGIWRWILDARKFYAHKFTSITTCLYFICFYLLRQNLAEGLHEDKKEDIYPKK